MKSERFNRKLTALLAADVVGYSRLMAAEEERTLARLNGHRRDLIDPKVAEHMGRTVKTTGDGFLIEFASVVDAVRCAVEIQQSMAERDGDVAVEQRITLRIGVNVGDVIIEGDDLYGDGVNTAARLEGLAEPGTVYVSGAVYEQVRDKLPYAFEDLGEHHLKNLARPVRTYRIRSTAMPADTAVPRAALPLPDRPSIAVLPFANLSGDPEQQYFVDGVVEEIITALSRVRWLFVIARNSTLIYRARAIDVKQVGRELGVRYVLEGSCRRATGKVRITAQLIDSMSGAHLWADRYDGVLDDIFDLQDRIAESVVGVIEPKLRIAETERASRKPTDSLDAHDCFWRAMPLVYGMTKDGNEAALSLLRRAIALDPNYATAYGLAAQCYVFRRTMNWATSDEEAAEGARLARTGVALGGDDPTALWMAGQALAFLARDHEGAIAAVDRSLALNPSSASAYAYSGWIRQYSGEIDQALDHFGRAARLSPYDPMEWVFYAGMGYCHLYARRYEDAIAAASRALRSNPNWAGNYRVLAASYAHLDRPEEAHQALRALLRIDPGLSITKFKNVINVMQRPELAEILCDGLRKAGLPE